jgi:hypothetical protein
MKMHRKVSFISFHVSSLFGECQFNLIYDSIAKGFKANSKNWYSLKLRIIERALNVCPDDHVVNARARCFFISEKLFSFYSAISRQKQEEYFGFLVKMHIPQLKPNELNIFPFFNSFSLSNDANLPRSGTGRAKERIFIYSPIQQEEPKPVPVLVLGEPVNFVLSLYNPLECTVLLKNIKLVGIGFECSSFDFVLLPKSCVNSTATLIPSESGNLCITGVSFNIESWKFLHTLKENKFINNSSGKDTVSFQVIESFPLAKVEIPTCSYEIFEGQELRIPFSIQCHSSFLIASIIAFESEAEDQLEYEIKDSSTLILYKIPSSSVDKHQITLSVSYTSSELQDFFRVVTADFTVKQRKSVRFTTLKIFQMPKEPLSNVSIVENDSSFHVFPLSNGKLPGEHSLMLCDLENSLIEKATVKLGEFSIEIPPLKATRLIFPVPKAALFNLNQKFLLNHLRRTCGMTWNSSSSKASGEIQWPLSFFNLSLLVPKKFHIQYSPQSFAVGKIFHLAVKVSIHIYHSVRLRIIAPKEIALEQDYFYLAGNSSQTLELKGASFVRGNFEIQVLILLNDNDDANACDDANECECLQLEIN